MVRAAAGNLPEQNKNNKCVNRPPETAVKKYARTYDLPCTFVEVIATAFNTFIVLLESVESYLVVIFLVTSFAISVLRNELNLNNNRIAYAKAF